MITSICARSATLAWWRRRSARPSSRVFPLSPDEWVLSWRTPDSAPAHRKHRVRGIVQLPLFDLESEAVAVGADAGSGTRRSRPNLHLVREPEQSFEPEQ